MFLIYRSPILPSTAIFERWIPIQTARKTDDKIPVIAKIDVQILSKLFTLFFLRRYRKVKRDCWLLKPSTVNESSLGPKLVFERVILAPVRITRATWRIRAFFDIFSTTYHIPFTCPCSLPRLRRSITIIPFYGWECDLNEQICSKLFLPSPSEA